MEERMTLILQFSPMQTCSIGDCTELTGIGQLSGDILMPACPIHGLAYECDQSEQFTSVVRFVNHIFDGEGKAKVVRVASLEEVSGYQAYEDALSTDIAWLVEWSSGERSMQVWVVWVVDTLSFEIFQ
jgi:hypothetical protein